ELLEFLDSELDNEELNPSPITLLLFTKPCEDTRDRLGCREQLLFGKKLLKQFCVVWHRAQSASDIELESAPRLAVLNACHRDRAHIVHIHQTAGFLTASGEGDLELASEVLRIRVPQH